MRSRRVCVCVGFRTLACGVQVGSSFVDGVDILHSSGLLHGFLSELGM